MGDLVFAKDMQNLQRFSWSLENVQHQLASKLTAAASDVFSISCECPCSYREAAYHIATKRLKEAFYAAGF